MKDAITLGAGAESTTSASWYFMTCDVVPSGVVYSYYWEEND